MKRVGKKKRMQVKLGEGKDAWEKEKNVCEWERKNELKEEIEDVKDKQ